MKPSTLTAACLLATVLCTQSCTFPEPERLPIVHAHRGGAALYPENTIPAMVHAASIGVPVMELDLHVTKDSMVVVSHDAYLNARKALTPEGDTIPKADEKSYRIYSMTYDSLRRYDVGSLPNAAYPRRENLKCCIPLVSDLITCVEETVRAKGLPPVSYNIEIKSSPKKDNIYSPDYRTFADLCMKALLNESLGDRLLVQCFDVRTLNYLHQQYPDVRLSYLVEKEEVPFEELMQRLDFVPQVFSPHSSMLDSAMVAKAHALGMEIAAWTVDDKTETLRLKALGTDAIISNCPDSTMVWLGYPTEEK